MSPSCMAWLLVDYAASAIGAVVVPLYESVNRENLLYTLGHSEIEHLFAAPSSVDKLDVAVGSRLKTIVMFDACQRTHRWCRDHPFMFEPLPAFSKINACDLPSSPHSVSYPRLPSARDVHALVRDILLQGTAILPISELLAAPLLQRLPPRSTPDDIHTIIYTSGTTGNPKGAMIKESNLCACSYAMAAHIRENVLNLRKHAPSCYDILAPEEDMPADTREYRPPPAAPVAPRYLSFLPLAHVLERATNLTSVISGFEICFFSGSIQQLAQDIRDVQPGILCLVPRVLQKFKSLLDDSVKKMGFVKRKIFERAVRVYTRDFLAGKTPTGYNRLVFNRIREQFGNHIEIIFVGGAPSPPGLMDFWMAALDCHSSQGYGMTETAAAMTASVAGPAWTNQGFALAAADVRITSRPELGYLVTSDPPTGEIIVRGPQVFSGYFKEPEKSAAAFTDEGFFRTGDIAQVLPDGSLNLIDRVSSIFKLSQGEYVCSEKLESVYQRSSFISQVFITGDSTHSELVAIIVPNMPAIRHHFAALKKKAHAARTDAELLSSRGFQALLFASMLRKATEAKVPGYETVRLAVVDPLEWNSDNGFCTPSLKIKRNVVKQFYADDVARLYALPDTPSALDKRPGSKGFQQQQVSPKVFLGSFDGRRFGVALSVERQEIAECPALPKPIDSPTRSGAASPLHVATDSED